MGAHCSSDPVLGPFLDLSWPNADAPSWRRKTPYVVKARVHV